MTNKVYTHNGTFHADEISAIALLQVFIPSIDYSIERVDHQTTEFPNAHYVIDTGRQYDNITRFDHHQWEGGKSSAGIIWQHLKEKLELDYPSIDDLVEAIDHNDVGVKPATKYEYSRLISMYNTHDIHSPAQFNAFLQAIQFAKDIFTSLKNNEEVLKASEIVCKKALYWPGTTDVLELPGWTLGWSDFINGETMPHIEAVVWTDKKLGTWNIQTTNKSTTSYEKVGKKLLPCGYMTFVHSNNFFAVAPTRALMHAYINKKRAY